MTHIEWMESRLKRLNELLGQEKIGSKEWLNLSARIGELEECIENAKTGQ